MATNIKDSYVNYTTIDDEVNVKIKSVDKKFLHFYHGDLVNY